MSFYTVAMFRNDTMTIHGKFSHELAAHAKRRRLRTTYRYCDIRVIQPGEIRRVK